MFWGHCRLSDYLPSVDPRVSAFAVSRLALAACCWHGVGVFFGWFGNDSGVVLGIIWGDGVGIILV